MERFFILLLLIAWPMAGIFAQPNPLMSMGGGLADSLSSVLDCSINGKSGLCVPSALKDIVCAPLGFESSADIATCGTENVCCHSTVDRNVTTTGAPTNDSGKNCINFIENVSCKLSVRKAALPASGSAIVLLTVSPDAATTPATDQPQSIKIPASLSAYIPGFQSEAASKSKIKPKPQKPVPTKLCRIGNSQGMCVNSQLVGSLCKPMGFLISKTGCSPGFTCCYTGSPDSSDNEVVLTTPVTTGTTPIKKVILDNPSSMDTCSPQAGQAGLCIRNDIAPAVCAPLGFTIGEQLTCAADRVCCHTASPSPTGAITATNFALAAPPTVPPSKNMLGGRSCQVSSGIVGVCVPPSLISSCPLFGRKISAFGCATKPLEAPEYCCYESPVDSVRNKPEMSESDAGLTQPFIAVAGSAQAPKLDAMVCGRKGLTGIEPRALARTSRLLGAQPSLPGEYCWHAALFDENLKPFCNGVLVNRQWVLTAAHCVKRVGPTNTTVKLGLWSMGAQQADSPQRPPQTFRVLEAFIHFNYDGVTLDNNIALLHLDSEADFSEPHVCLACLPSDHDYEGATCTVTSWPTPDGNAPADNAVLNKLDLTIINHTKCDRDLKASGKLLQPSFRLNADATICAQANDGEDTCRGDGGSGLTCPNSDGIYELVGLVSWGLACGLGTPTILTRVWLYNSWVQEIIRRYS